MIKRILMVIVMVLLLVSPASAAWYLACDIPTDNATGSIVRVDGNEVPGLFQVSTDGQALLLLDLTPYTDGAGHTFEARFTSNNTLPSAWTAPFVPGVLMTPALRLFQQ